jgi:hypothetical protein
VLCRGGFFEGDDDFCQALVDGGCVKALQLQLARDVEGAQFVEALEEALAPRMRLMGGEKAAHVGVLGWLGRGEVGFLLAGGFCVDWAGLRRPAGA